MRTKRGASRGALTSSVWFGCVVAALVGCAPRPQRPAPGATIAAAVGDDEGLAVVVFTGPKEEGKLGLHVARHSAEGTVRWARRLEAIEEFDFNAVPWVFPGSAVIGVQASPRSVGGGLIHVALADGADHRWAPEGEATVQHVIGDERQVFVVWRADPIEGGPARLEIAAHDAATGARVWTARGSQAEFEPQIRLDDKYLLLAEHGSDWQALRRSDGARIEMPVLDAPGLCQAAGVWWGQRDDRLVALDLRGEAPTQREAPASFIAEALRHQWALIDCATRGEEVVLKVERMRHQQGALVGVDPQGLGSRWTIDLPHAFGALPAEPSRQAWPPTIGDFTVVRQGPGGAREPCAVDLVGRRVLWCMRWNDSQVHFDGEDVVLVGQRWVEEQPSEQQVVRMSGRDGSITAAAAMPAEAVGAPTGVLRGGKLWLPLADRDPGDTTTIPLMALDAGTLRPITRPGIERAEVRDVLAEIGQVLPRQPEVIAPHAEEWPLGPVQLHAANPWDDVFHGHGVRDPADSVEYRDETAAIVATARRRLGLAESVAFRVVGRRPPMVVAFAEVPDSGRWILVRGSSPEFVATRTFSRRPAASDVYRFVLEEGRPDITTTPPGTTDEAAWLALTGEARGARWLIP